MHLTVLVVDDDADNAESMARLINLWGHDASIAKDGKTALVAVEDNRPDVMLFDLSMPGMSGLELVRKVRQKQSPKRLVLIAITGYADQESMRKSMEAGAHMHLAKPVDPELLKKLLERAAVHA